MAANRTTLLWAVEVLCVAEFLSQGLVLYLERMIGILVRGNLAWSIQGSILSTIVGVILPFMVNLHFIRCFLEELQPEAETIDFTVIQRRHIAIAILCILLLALGLLLGTGRYLRTSRPPGLEDRRRRLEELWNTVSALFDAAIGLLLALRSHQIFWEILVVVSQSRNILEASLDQSGISERMNQISKGRVLLGWLLELQTAHTTRILENVFVNWVLDALDNLE
ncbi:hypothetical protein INS49_015872 [Diaporthe citri]|uniref:uncharacterized protein n=1 Tax=Diaporthe citri TaxID=83186 RepID=UPI001C810743|nr:uncharacterized protein INS49_015872 [Diaporthe citri]KAG6356484.1 hypothetical protein INS49_015872 [Diaporthe citri]